MSAAQLPLAVQLAVLLPLAAVRWLLIMIQRHVFLRALLIHPGLCLVLRSLLCLRE